MKAEKKAVLASSIGNILEFYDFALYGFFAQTLSKLYFPLNEPIASLFVFYGVFAVGFICRPIGAVLFGYIGDKFDRRSTLSLSLFGIALATLFMGLLPTYEKWGLMAPISLTLLRVIQGISLGGEYTNSLIFVSEHMEKVKAKHPALATGMVSSMGLLGWFAASFLSIYFKEESLSLFCWRIPFLIGSLVAVVGIYLRKHVSDAFRPVEKNDHTFLSDLVEVFRHPKEMLPPIGVGLLMGALFYGQFIFGTTFLPLVANLSREMTGKVISFGLFSYMIALPLLGFLSDRLGHKRVVLSSCFACVLLAPILFQLEASSSLVRILFAQVLVAILLAALMAPGTFLMSLNFPPTVRCLGVSLSYNIGAAVIGGMVPSINLGLYNWHHNPLDPAYFLAVTALLSGVFLILARGKPAPVSSKQFSHQTS